MKIEILMKTYKCGSVSCADSFTTTIMGKNWNFRLTQHKSGQVSDINHNNLHFTNGEKVNSDDDFTDWLNLESFSNGQWGRNGK